MEIRKYWQEELKQVDGLINDMGECPQLPNDGDLTEVDAWLRRHAHLTGLRVSVETLANHH